MNESDQLALAIYFTMACDVVDALDMITACSDAAALETLATMLEAVDGPNTDRDLNEVMLAPVRQRLESLRRAA